MTWEELERLPEEIAAQIELGMVMWCGLRRGPGEHQIFTRRLMECTRTLRPQGHVGPNRALLACQFRDQRLLREDREIRLHDPDFLVHRCLDAPRTRMSVPAMSAWSARCYRHPTASQRSKQSELVMPTAGSPGTGRSSCASTTARSIPCAPSPSRLAPDSCPDGVQRMHRANYLLVGEWTHADENGVEISHPFPISIPWSELEF